MAEIPVCVFPFDSVTSSPREQDGYARPPLSAAVVTRDAITFGCRSGERVTPRRAVAALVVLGRDESDGVLKRH
jgi:hypothetical protein